jgi:hypothetical protein
MSISLINLDSRLNDISGAIQNGDDVTFQNVDMSGLLTLTNNNLNSNVCSFIKLKMSDNNPTITHGFFQQTNTNYGDYQIYPSNNNTDLRIGNYTANNNFSRIRLNANNGIKIYKDESNSIFGDLSCQNLSLYGFLNVDIIKGGSTIVIDPAVHDNNTGKLIIKGDLEVQGTTTTINSTTLDICDNRIKLNADSNIFDTAGIDISFSDGTNKSFYYSKSDNKWKNDNTDLDIGNGSITANTFIGDGSQLTGINTNLKNYDDASFGNVDISGNLSIQGDIDMSGNILMNNSKIVFEQSDDYVVSNDNGIISLINDLCNNFYDLSSNFYDLSENLLKQQKDASFNNVDISGNVNINGGLTINNSFGASGEVLTSQGSGNIPTWTTPVGGVTDVSNLDASSVSLIELSNNTLFYTPPSGSSLSDYGIFTLAGTYTHDLRTTGNTTINILSQVLVSGGVTLLNSSQIQLANVGTYVINYMFDVQQISGTGVFGMALILAPTSGQYHYNGQWWTVWTTYTGSWVITTTTANTKITFQTNPHYHPQHIRIAGGASQNQISVFKMV